MTGDIEVVDEDGSFVATASLELRRSTEMQLLGFSSTGQAILLDPPTFAIRHGIALSDPPLSRSVGVALANGSVHTYFERGSPLPMRRSFSFQVVDAVSPGDHTFALQVPIVQGEFPLAHLCRLVGALEIPSHRLSKTIPAGTRIEVTLSVDRGGGLEAHATIEGISDVFDGVAHLVTPNLDAAALAKHAMTLRSRVGTLYSDAAMSEVPNARDTLHRLDRDLDAVMDAAETAIGGDADALEKGRRQLLDIDGTLSELEAKKAWPELEREAESDTGWAALWVGQYGSAVEQQSLNNAVASLNRARLARDVVAMKRHLALIDGLGQAAYFKSPGAWAQQFQVAASRISEASDVRAAQKLVSEGNAASARDDRAALEAVTRRLWKLLPVRREAREKSHGSSIR